MLSMLNPENVCICSIITSIKNLQKNSIQNSKSTSEPVKTCLIFLIQYKNRNQISKMLSMAVILNIILVI